MRGFSEKRARPGQTAAKELVEGGALEQLRRAEPELASGLLAIAKGQGGRNAVARLNAIRYALDHLLGTPTHRVEHSGDLRIEVVDPYAKGRK